ncbi:MULTISPECIES: hypothetical protein [unclassified Glutamicibacter]|uniref:hypothetical protein n=1 Tax=unclassified Glutamicibacter TaxID=2627139 RepID=UPI003829A1CE
MPAVTGYLKDLVGAAMANRQGVLVFRPNEAMVQAATTTPGTIHSTAEVRVTPASNGSFSVNLTATTVMATDCFYTLRIEWVDGAGPSMDFPGWQIRVPVGAGGSLDQFIVIGPPDGGWGGSLPNLSLVLMSLTFPGNLQRGQLWWKTDPDDPQNYNGRNTGEIHRGV